MAWRARVAESLREMPITQTSLAALRDPAAFMWAAGIEDTFITAPWPKTGRTLDEYELTQHYEQWRTDLELFREIGVRTVRYGIPWHRINPAPNTWDWKWADEPLNHLLELGIEPIVDLIHYGLPLWMEEAFLHPSYPDYAAEFTQRVTERYRGRITAYTPLNEPRITAWYCGKLGWWPPFRRGWKGFLQLTRAVCRGIVLSCQAIRAAHPENVAVHVDATDLYESDDPALAPEVERRQAIVFLALDLINGRVGPGHTLYPWLHKHGMAEADLHWFRENGVNFDLVGINLYPMFSRKILSRTARGLRIRMPYAEGEIVERLARMYAERYDAPVFISETAAVGSVKKRRQWLQDSVESVRRARADGIPLVGYTWWPLFALVTWAYRQGMHPPSYYLKQFGLYDVAPNPEGRLVRLRTPLVDAFRELAEGGADAVGRLTAAATDPAQTMAEPGFARREAIPSERS